MILGTAGHIDHGKTTLVRALTGVDTDRLPEEKRRGITIELGFAPLALEGVGQVGIVDVPGHEAFVRTMVAGAAGIDMALLVIAADAGFMPQTHEHLAILRILGVSHGVVALTKCDRVDDDWLGLLEDEVRATLAHSSLADAPMVRTSATSGAGLHSLRNALRRVALDVPARSRDDLFRMPIDRAFTVRGTGTVVTGTVWSGSVDTDAELTLFPGDRGVRIRGIQSYGSATGSAHAGQRAALALAGVDLAEISRTGVLTAGSGWRESLVLRAELRPVDDAMRWLSPRSRVRFHVGTYDVSARVVTQGATLEKGEPASVRLVLDEPVVCRAGDRFVLRSTSPLGTLGGGVVLDPHAPRRARPFDSGATGRDGVLARILTEVGAAGVARADLAVRIGIPLKSVSRFLRDQSIWQVGAVVLGEHAREAVCATLTDNLRDFHRLHPLESGAPVQWLRSRVGAGEEAIDAAIEVLRTTGKIQMRSGSIALSGFSPTLSEQERALSARVMQSLAGAGVQPPSFAELASSLEVSERRIADVARLLMRAGELVAVEPDRYYSAAAVSDLKGRMEKGMHPGREYSPAEIKEMLDLTRKFTIPFLEYCDSETYTIRGQSGRRLALRNG